MQSEYHQFRCPRAGRTSRRNHAQERQRASQSSATHRRWSGAGGLGSRPRRSAARRRRRAPRCALKYRPRVGRRRHLPKLPRVRRALLLLLLAAVLAGCGDGTSISGGGKMSGRPSTVYSFVPRGPARRARTSCAARSSRFARPAARRRVRRQLRERRQPPEERRRSPHAVRGVVLDTGIIAVIGDLDSRTARVTVPLLNAAGLLHVSPRVTGSLPAAPRAGRRSSRSAPTTRPGARVRRSGARSRGGRGRGTETAQALADAVTAEAGGTVPTATARTVFYAGSDPVNALGVVQGVLDENRRATVVLPQELCDERSAGRRGRAARSIPHGDPDPAEFATGFRAAYPGKEPDGAGRVGVDRHERRPRRSPRLARAARAT